MSAKAGLSHHLKAESAKKKQDYLKGIASGMTNDAASKIAGIKPDTVKYWIKSDKAFREELDNARTDRDNVRANLKTADKLAVNFEAFSEEYLEMKVFPHQRNFISLLEKGKPA